MAQSRPHGTFFWNELMTRDAAKATAFYTEAIGWTFDEMPMPDGTYHIAKSGGTAVAGIFESSGDEYAGQRLGWIAYLAVDDIDARLKAAKAAGATILRAPFDVPGIGRIAILKDGGDGVIGWMTPAAG